MAKSIDQFTNEELQAIVDTGLGPAGSLLTEEEPIGLSPALEDVALPKTIEQDEQRDRDIEVFANSTEFGDIPVNDIINNITMLKNDPIIIETPDDKIGFRETFKEAKKLELLPFVGSMYKTKKLTNILDAAKVLNTGKVLDIASLANNLSFDPLTARPTTTFQRDATDKEKADALKLIQDWIIELDERQGRGVSIRGRIAEGLLQLPSFMVEFLVTGPLFKTGSVAGKRAALRILGKYAEEGTGKYAAKLAGAGFGSLLRTGVNVPRVLQGAAESMTAGIQTTDSGAIVFRDASNNPFNALARSFTELYIENITEVAGKEIGKAAKFGVGFIGKKFPVIQKFTQTLADKWVVNAPEGVTRTLTGFLKTSATKIGYDGILEEMGEEQLGRILRSATGLQTFAEIIPTWEELLVEAGVLLPIGGVSLAADKVFRRDAPVEPVEKRLGPVEVILRPEQGVSVTPEALMEDRIRLFESEKNVKLSEEQNRAALAFLRERIGESLSLKDKLALNILPDDFGEFFDKAEQTIVKNTIDTKMKGIRANVQEAAVEETGTIDAIRRTILRTEDVLGFWGSAGRKVQSALRTISARTAKNTGNTTQNVKAILKGLDRREKVIVSQLVDGAIKTKGQPPRLVARAEMLKNQLDVMQNEAIRVGLRKGKLTGKAFPQVLNDKGKAFLQEAETEGAQSHRVFAWAQNKVTEGKFKTVDFAIAALQNYRKNRLRGTEGYFEGKRELELDLDMREWSPDKILPGIIEGGWENIEAARQWGVTEDGNFKSIRTDIERIRSEVGVDQANAIEDYIKAQYGQSRASATAKKWSKRVRAVQFVGKLALSPLTITRNMLDRYAKGLTHGTIGTNIRATIQFPPFLNKFMKTSQRIQDEMIRRGAVLGHGHLSEGFFEGRIQNFIGQPFALSEKGNQTYIAIIKKLQLEADLRRLNEMGGENGTVGNMYNRLLGIIGQSQSQTRKRVLTDLTNEQLTDALEKSEISDDVMSEVLHRTVTDSAFPLTLASKRMWWGNRPWLQAATQFKIWSADQMRFMYKDVLKYTVATGDPSRLARFIIGTWLVGEIYNIARDFITNKDESLLSTLQDRDGRNFTEISKSIANALVDGGLVGMLADLTYGITDWAFGPTIASLESAARVALAVKNDPATTADGLKKFLLDDIPAAKQVQGILDRIDRTFFNENNLTENYAKWRQRSFEFKKKRGDLSVAERTTGRFIFGQPSRVPGPRTLSLEMLSRQVLVGDFDDGAQYIKGIFRDTPIEKVSEVIQAINTSARNRSPIGNIPRKDIIIFLNQFSAEGQAEVLSLQEQWQNGYVKSIEIAIKELEAEGFEGELKEKAKLFAEKMKIEVEKFKSTEKELIELLKRKETM